MKTSHNAGKFIDRTGQVFGRLTVRRTYQRQFTSGRLTLCDCVCSCGNKTTVRAQALHAPGNPQTGTKSCGCWRDELTRERRKAARKAA